MTSSYSVAAIDDCGGFNFNSKTIKCVKNQRDQDAKTTN